MIKRLVASFVAVALLVGMLEAGAVVFAPAAQANADARECWNEDSDNYIGVGRNLNCVNGAKTYTRSEISVNCLEEVRRGAISTNPRFRKFTCNESKNPKSMQPERIAQARFITWLDARDRLNWPESAGRDRDAILGWSVVHPGVQWEVQENTNPWGRADVVNYRPLLTKSSDPSPNDMKLWELKTSMSYDSYERTAQQANFEASLYASQLTQEKFKGLPFTGESLWRSLRIAPAGNAGFNYTDNFRILVRECGDRNNAVKTAEEHFYNVFDDAAHPGSMVAERTVRKWKCEKRNQQQDQRAATYYEEELPYQNYRWWEHIGETNPAMPLPADPIITIPPALCGKLRALCKLLLPVSKKPTYVTAGFLNGAGMNTDLWQDSNGPLCEAVAAIERAQGSTSTPVAAKCFSSASFEALLDDADFVGLLDGLSDDDAAAVLESLFVSIDREGVGNVSTPARVTGDPHLVTLDGLNYDMQSVGEFWLLGVPDRGVRVQARFAAAGTQSSMVALATQWGDTTVELHADGTLIVGGQTKSLAPGRGVAPAVGGYIVNDDGTYRLSWAGEGEDDAPVTLAWQPLNAGLGSFGVQVPAGVATRGLLGDHDGDPLNDLKLATGEAVDASDAVAIHGTYADSWRITGADSLFTYPAGQTTATYTDLTFPQEIVTLGDFTAAEQAGAQLVCEANGVVDGVAFRNCMLDVLVTNDANFAAAFAGAQEPARSADDKVMDSSGVVTQTFGAATTPPNFAPIRVTDDATLGKVAGPFTAAEQYRFYVPALPRHDQVTVEFDLIATGTWDGPDAVGIRVDTAPTQTLDLTGATPGVTADGTPTRTKHVTVAVDHFRELISVALAGSGLDPGQGFAIDNVTVSARKVAAQQYTPAITPGVSVGLRQPALPAGAGQLETWGAQDSYSLSLSNQDLLLDWQTRSASIKWTLTAPDGDIVSSGLSVTGNARIRDLDGEYTLSVEAAGDAPPTAETYSLDVLTTPPAQQFAFTLPGPVSLPGDLPASAITDGAGAIETKLSRDVYAFSVTKNDASVVINTTSCPYQGYYKRLSWTLLDAGGAIAASGTCWSQTVAGLAAGAYKLRVEAERETTGAYQIVVTQNGPVASFATAPAAATNQTSVTFDLGGDADTAGFECALNPASYAGPFTSCGPSKTYSNLSDGVHTFRVRAKDAAGVPGPAITHVFTVDTVAPDMQITRKPPAVSNINGPVLEYSATKQGMTYQCSLQPVGSAPEYAACSGVSVYRDLPHGSYRFQVVGRDWVGNTSMTAYEFMVDLEPPVITLTPASNLTSTASPQFTFTANETASYECSLVPAAQVDAFAPCTSPAQYSGLADGIQYRFLVKATDVAGQWSARGVTWTPYAMPPSVTITSMPPASSSNAAPTFAFTSNMTSPTYTCSLQLASAAQSFTACASPQSYSGKAAGTYKFTVKATDQTGSWVSSTYQFTITAASGDSQTPTTPGTPSAVIAPAGSVLGADGDATATGVPVRISWAASSDNVGVTGYQLWYSSNNGAYVNAGNVSGTAVTMTLPPGTTSWRFQIRAFDAAGNLSTTSTASPAIVVGVTQEAASSQLTYAGTWTAATSSASSGGATRYASVSSASATFKPSTGATQVAVVMATGPGFGKATVSVDGGAATTVDLYAPTAGQRSVVFSSVSLSATAAHTIVVKPTGSKAAASTGTRVDVDAFVVRR